MQQATDADLAAAIASPNRVVRQLLEVDWDRNGLYTNYYSDLSKVSTQIDIDFSAIKGDIPDEVNTVVGSSSAVMTVELHGQRSQDAWRVAQLFSKYLTSSPLFAYTKEGTPIRHTIRELTVSGWKATRQFTGWITSFVSDEDNDKIVLTCSDVYDMQTSLATLPVYAIGPAADANSSYNANRDYSGMHTIDTQWVYEELLRAGGRHTGPAPRTECIAYWTCAGSLLPSVGTMADGVSSDHRLSYAYQDFTEAGQYGRAIKASSYATPDNVNAMAMRGATALTISGVGTGNAQATSCVCFAGWFKSTGAATAGFATSVKFVPGTSYTVGADPAFIQMDVYNSGAVNLRAIEDSRVTSPVEHRATFSTTLAAGWHYLAGHMYFTQTAITAQLWVDGVLATQTGSLNLGSAFNNVSGAGGLVLRSTEKTNGCLIVVGDGASCQHVQIYGSFNTNLTYNATQSTPPSTAIRDGRALGSLDRTMTELAWLPDVNKKVAWEVFKEAVSGELGCLYTDEYGVVTFKRRDTVWYDAGVAASIAIVIPRSKLSGLALNPSANLYRNAVSLSASYTNQVRALVWQSADPLQFYAKGTEPSTFVWVKQFAVSGVVCMYTTVTAPVSSDRTVPNLGATTVTTVKAADVTLAAGGGWIAFTDWATDQRSIVQSWGVGPLTYDVYVGTNTGGQQAQWDVGGRKLDTVRVNRQTFTNATEVTSRGYSLLELPDSSWRQTDNVSSVLATSLLRDLINPAPVITDMSIAPDQRLQLLDVIGIPGGPNITGQIKAQVIGKKYTWRGDQADHKITVRVLSLPQQSLYDVSGVGYDTGVYS